MALSAKNVRAQLNRLTPLMENRSLETIRKGQNALGSLMSSGLRREIIVKKHDFSHSKAAWVLPKDERRQGVILYLHGGGYCTGDLDYAKGFGSTLAVHCGVRVLCLAYRLAPENPYPAALGDAVESYRYLLEKGYDPNHICLCGESSGGGLCFSLCLKLKQLELPLPGSIIAISPWTDLTASGPSYQDNRKVDPSLRMSKIEFYRNAYGGDPKDPFVSPLFGDLTGLPPTLIFAGADEILLSDSQLMAQKLQDSGCTVRLVVRPERWHVYLLYGLEEDQEDMAALNKFLDQYHSRQRKLRWMRLDNAAKIYPAARRQNWSSMFRMSVTLTEEVDVPVLQSALDVTVRRFPSIASRLRRGVFWYYLEQISQTPAIQEDQSYPLARMSRKETSTCAFRILVYHRRIALEIFHSLTDGTGALIFLKSLLAEYLQQKYDLTIPAEEGVLGRLEEPSEEELEDSFQKYAGPITQGRSGNTAWRFRGTPELGGFMNVTCFQLSAKSVVAKAKEYGVSVTNFLGAVMMKSLLDLQAEMVPQRKDRKPIKVLLPVNLRRLFPSKTLRNFSLFITPEVDPRLGEFTLQEICDIIKHTMGLQITAKNLSKTIAANVGNERQLIVKLMPLFLKNFIMKMVYNAIGERQSSLNLSNLGQVKVPEVMEPYVDHFDAILGVQATSPYNCGVISYKDHLHINFIRNTRESALESHFFRVLQQMGLEVQVQSNRR